jgi:capsular exopolysaccharide synthesis family protein
MSRIHEALKRAEQERGVHSGLDQQVVDQGMPPAMAARMAATVVADAPMTFEALQARTARVPWNPDPKTMLFFGGADQALGKEEMRTLRSRLYQLRERKPLKKILITSALPKEGKSFLAANLAQVLVQQRGRRALLIDADLRAPRLHQSFGSDLQPGLSDYLLGEKDELSVIQQGPMENLFLIPGGQQVSNAAELVANNKLKTLMARMESMFDWIIVDSPPAALVSDASLLANFCDGVLMVVRSNVTSSEAARRARLEFAPEQLLGVVLNGIESNSSAYAIYHYPAYGQQPEVKKG